MVLDGSGAEVEASADVGVGEALGDEPQHLSLAIGQHRDALGLLIELGRRTGVRVQQGAGGSRGQHDPSGRQRPHVLAELLGLGVLQEESGGAGAEGGQDVLVGVEGREHRHGGALRQGRDDAQQGQPVDLGHSDVEQQHIGSLRLDHIERFDAGRGADDADVVGGVQDHREPSANEGLVVDDHDTDHGIPLSSQER